MSAGSRSPAHATYRSGRTSVSAAPFVPGISTTRSHVDRLAARPGVRDRRARLDHQAADAPAAEFDRAGQATGPPPATTTWTSWGRTVGFSPTGSPTAGTPRRRRAGDQGLALIPRGDLDLEETWFVAGMKSTGSNCLIATDV